MVFVSLFVLLLRATLSSYIIPQLSKRFLKNILSRLFALWFTLPPLEMTRDRSELYTLMF